jgi:hypothetical protein
MMGGPTSITSAVALTSVFSSFTLYALWMFEHAYGYTAYWILSLCVLNLIGRHGDSLVLDLSAFIRTILSPLIGPIYLLSLPCVVYAWFTRQANVTRLGGPPHTVSSPAESSSDRSLDEHPVATDSAKSDH